MRFSSTHSGYGKSPAEYLKPEVRNARFETPVDERGLVIIPDFINLVKSLVIPEYDWEDGRKPDTHHVYYPEWRYLFPHNPKLRIFRELPIHKLYVQRSFHELSERMIIPANVPHMDVVEHTIRSYKIAEPLYQSAHGLVRIPRSMRDRKAAVTSGKVKPRDGDSDRSARRYFQKIYDDCSKRFESKLRELESIPSEFRLVDLDQTGDSPHAIATNLGRVGLVQAMNHNRLNLLPVVSAT